MFVDRSYRWLDSDRQAALAMLLSTSTDTEIDTVSQPTILDRVVTLAQNFVDGVLTLTGLKADKIETKELCVDGVCVTGDELRQLLDGPSTNADAPSENQATDTPEQPAVATDGGVDADVPTSTDTDVETQTNTSSTTASSSDSILMISSSTSSTTDTTEGAARSTSSTEPVVALTETESATSTEEATTTSSAPATPPTDTASISTVSLESEEGNEDAAEPQPAPELTSEPVSAQESAPASDPEATAETSSEAPAEESEDT